MHGFQFQIGHPVPAECYTEAWLRRRRFRLGVMDWAMNHSPARGHTLFVEPLETIELNNELVRLREEEMREVHRILREFTSRLRVHATEIASIWVIVP